MIGANLIPTSLREARRHRRLVTRWIVGGAVYAGLLVITCVGARSYYYTDGRAIDQEVGDVVQKIAAADQTSRELKSQLTDLREKSETVRAIADQPDWSILLTAIAKTMGDELVLRELSITPAPESNSAKTVAGDPLTGPRKYTLIIRGLGRSSSSVSKFVSHLEETKFFDEVKLAHTGREPFLTGMATSFDLECTFGSSAAAGRQK